MLCLLLFFSIYPESEPEPDPAPDDDQPGPSHSHGTAPLSNDVELARLRCTEMLPFSDSLLPVQDLLPRNNPLYNHEQVQVPQSSGPASLGGRGRGGCVSSFCVIVNAK